MRERRHGLSLGTDGGSGLSGCCGETRPTSDSRGPSRLPQLARVPDRSRREPVVAFPPGGLGVPLVINRHVEIVTEGKAEAIGKDVAESGNIRSKRTLTRPRRAAVG